MSHFTDVLILLVNSIFAVGEESSSIRSNGRFILFELEVSISATSKSDSIVVISVVGSIAILKEKLKFSQWG